MRRLCHSPPALLCAVAWLAFSVCAPVALAADEYLGVHRDWSAMRYAEDDGKACMIWSQPKKAQGNYQRRGEVFVFVTHRPASKRFGAVSVEAGYSYRKGEPVTVRIGEHRFELASSGSTAWSTSATQDRDIVAAMQAGREMVVEGTSSRGTRTADTYSLYGFSAAHRAISKACPAPA